jgi:pimeloyl-ACP methyl ester carboxylesterase
MTMTTLSDQKSTIVRPKNRVRLVRSSFAALERVAPSVGARAAERLWFTVPRARAAPVPEGGSPFDVQLRGRTVRGWSWGAGPVVYLVHGWGGEAGQLGAFVRPLVAAGFTVVAHDAPSHGISAAGHRGPRSSDIIELAQSLDAVAASYGPAHAVVGHSMGGMTAMMAIRDGWLGAQRLVMVAPMVRVVDAEPVFAGRLGLGPRIQRRLVHRIERQVAAPLTAFDIAALAPDVGWPPLLAIHDRDDTETPWRATEALVAGWPNSELVTTQGLGHRRILRDPTVIRTVTDTLVADATRGLQRPA